MKQRTMILCAIVAVIGLSVLFVVLLSTCRAYYSRALSVPPLRPVATPPPVFCSSGGLTDKCSLAELTCWASADGAPVAAIGFQDRAKSLVAAYASTPTIDGKLRRWRIGQSAPLGTYNLGSVALKAAQFSRYGGALYTAGGKAPSPQEPWGALGVRVWDAFTGKLLLEDRRFTDPRTGLAVAVSGSSVLSYSDDSGGLVFWPIGDGGYSWTEQAGIDLDAALPLRPVAAALDEVGEVGAYAVQAVTDDGEIATYAESNGLVRLAGPNKRLWRGWKGTRVLALAFDPPRRYLAILREDSLAVVHLGSLYASRNVTIPFPLSADGILAFNATGDLLAIGTERGWEMRRSSDLRLVAQEQGEHITALVFSSDGCLLASGSSEGAVRVYGCETPGGT